MSRSSPSELAKVKRKSAAVPASASVKKKAPAKANASGSSNRRRNTSTSTRSKSYDEFFDQKQNQAASITKSKSNVSPKKKAKRKKQKKLKWYQLLFRSFTVFICLIFAWLLFAYYSVISYEQKPLTKADAGIILGAALWNNVPSPALKERLDHAITLYEQGLVDYLILSGGSANGVRGISEAEGMKNYLVEANIPEDRLLLEGQSSDTYENLLYSKRVLERSELNTVIIISHNYHVKRAADIAKFVEYPYVQTSGVKTTTLNETYHYTREMLAYSKWQLNKLLIPLGIKI